MYLKEAPGMGAYGTYLGGFSTYADMTAVTALPNLDLAFLEYLSGFDVIEQSPIAFLVSLFDGGYHTEFGRQIVEALGVRRVGKTGVHIRPFIVFALGGGLRCLEAP